MRSQHRLLRRAVPQLRAPAVVVTPLRRPAPAPAAALLPSGVAVQRRFCSGDGKQPGSKGEQKPEKTDAPAAEKAATEQAPADAVPAAEKPDGKVDDKAGKADEKAAEKTTSETDKVEQVEAEQVKPEDPKAAGEDKAPGEDKAAANGEEAKAPAKKKKKKGKEKEKKKAPKGFDHFFADKYPKASEARDPEPDGAAISPFEYRLLNQIAGEKRQRLLRRRAAITACIVAGYFFYTRFDLYTAKVLLGLEEPVTLAHTRAVTVSLESHRAKFYDAARRLIGDTTFIDFGSFEGTVRGMQTTATPEEVERGEAPGAPKLFISVPSYFPMAAIAFLWLLPVLVLFHRGFNSSVTAARVQSKQQMNSGSMNPSGHKFRFKLDHHVKTRLPDVAGLTEVKSEVVEIIDFLKNPTRYTHLGAHLPKGVLLDGPPGVGKTLLAKAVAGEAKVPFVSCSGSEFEEVYVGVGAQRVRQLFKMAQEKKPCVIFIDEIDTFGRKRRNDRGKNSRGTINALLSELDGFKDSQGIIVLAATNRADILDEALTRSGRFDRKISIDKPPQKDRAAIAKVHLRPLKLDQGLSADTVSETLASMTPGCTGADIYNICNEAAITASREAKKAVDMPSFSKALDRILIGMEKKQRSIKEYERERLAYHEAGHVVLAWFLENVDPVLKATIVPRGGKTTGVTKKLPTDRFITTQATMREGMVQHLGGYVAEERFFEDVSTYAAEDLSKVTEMATNEVCVYGMAPESVGHFGFEHNPNAVQRPFGTAKADAVDKCVRGIAEGSLDRARAMLIEYETQVKIVAGMLLKDETVTARQLWVVLGPRPNMTPEFTKYLETTA